jgi:hypothetical protein
MDTTRAIKLFFFVLTCGALLYLAATDPVYATGDCKGHSCNDSGGDVVVGVNTDVITDVTTTLNTSSTLNNTSTMNGGDLVGGDTNVSTGGNKSLALANGLGDVDIAGCLGSTQFGTPLFSKQKLVINNVCLAQFYLDLNKYALAAMALCNIPGIIKEFESEDECRAAHDFAPIYEAAVIVEDDYDEQYRMEQQMRYDELEQKIEAIPAPTVIERTIIEEKPILSQEIADSLRY